MVGSLVLGGVQPLTDSTDAKRIFLEYTARDLAMSGHWFGLALTMIGSIWVFFITPSLDAMRDSRDDAQDRLAKVVTSYTDLVSAQLRLFAENKKLTGSHRLSLFRAGSRGFTLLGRHSGNPDLEKCANKFLSDQPCAIKKAWQNKSLLVENLPDPLRQTDQYYEKMELMTGMPRHAAQKCTMKSRAFFAVRINGKNDKPGAVLILESTNATIDKRIRTALENQEVKRLEKFLERIIELEPSSDIARDRGF